MRISLSFTNYLSNYVAKFRDLRCPIHALSTSDLSSFVTAAAEQIVLLSQHPFSWKRVKNRESKRSEFTSLLYHPLLRDLFSAILKPLAVFLILRLIVTYAAKKITHGLFYIYSLTDTLFFGAIGTSIYGANASVHRSLQYAWPSFFLAIFNTEVPWDLKEFGILWQYAWVSFPRNRRWWCLG